MYQTNNKTNNMGTLRERIKKLSMNSTQFVHAMNGCEVNSLNYEGCVAIKKHEVIRDGEVIDTLDTDEKISELWREYCHEEGF